MEQESIISWKMLFVVFLIAAIAISPRFSVGDLANGRSIDLRYEDFIFIIMLVYWSIGIFLWKEKVYYTSLLKPILIYVIFALVSTALGIFQGRINNVNAFFFILKEIEYFLMFLLTANFVGDLRSLKVIVYSLNIFAMANGFFGIFQFLKNRFQDIATIDMGSIGEPSRFLSGGYFAIGAIFSLVSMVFLKEKKIKIFSFFSCLVCTVALIGSGSRSNTGGLILSFIILLFFLLKDFLNKKKNFGLKIKPAIICTILIAIAIFFVTKLPSIWRFTNLEYMKTSFSELRVETIYKPLLEIFKKSPLIGLGKTACSIVIPGTGEAHNYYLRILIEMGIVGLCVFLYLVFCILKYSWGLTKSDNDLIKTVGFAGFLVCIQFLFASLTQDAFLPVKINETFWIIIGLVAASSYFNKKESYTNIQK